MYTRIEIDDELIKRAMQSTGLPTKSDVISLALRTLLDQSGADESGPGESGPGESGAGAAAEFTGWPSRPVPGGQADQAEPWTDLENFLSRLHRHVDFNLFAAQLGMSEQT